MKPLDFDHWCQLARTDPVAFERKRRQLVEDLIDDMHPRRRQRMRSLQWRIETVCARASSPTAACLAISNMMWDSLYRQQDLLTSFYGGEQPQSAEVIPLHCPLA